MARPDIVAAVRPPADRTVATSRCDRLDRDDAPPLGIRRVLTQVCHDLYGTKDVQNAITATYVWMADQIGHLTLGLVPTLLGCWILSLLWPYDGAPDRWHVAGFVAIGAIVYAYWLYKELTDLRDTKAQAGNVFVFDDGDLIWNIRTALLYFGIGGVFAIAAFIQWSLCLLAIVLALWPALSVAFWWLRRKLAFQQAGLPYLYRLANFTSQHPLPVQEIGLLANLKNRRMRLIYVLLGRDVVPRGEPHVRHILVTGPLGAGKTSLCVGIGTEFAFALGMARYLSAAKLVQLVLADRNADSKREYDDGRVLWGWRHCDLLLVDDVDAGVRAPTGEAVHLIQPDTFVSALVDGSGQPPLHWLAPRRSVWVVGDPATAVAWRRAIAGLLQISDSEIVIVELGTQTFPPTAPCPRDPGKATRDTAPG